MNNIQPILDFHSSVFFNKFKNLAKPLELLGIDGFVYASSSGDGSYFCLNNMPETVSYYFDKNLHLANPFIRHPDNYKHNQSIITSDYPCQPYKEGQSLVRNIAGFENFLYIYKKDSTMTHILEFSGSSPTQSLNSIFLNNHETLSQFSEYFINEWKPFLQKMDRYKIQLGEQMGAAFYKIDPKLQNADEVESRKKLLKKMGILEELPFKLTQREKACAMLFVKGQSNQSIAQELHISRKTVEYYMDSLKMKFCCASRNELFERLQFYHYHQLFA